MRRTAADPRLVAVLQLALATFVFLPGVGCELEHTSAAPAVDRLEKMIAAEREISYEAMKEFAWGSDENKRRSFLFIQKYPDGPSMVETAGVPAGRRRRWMQPGGRLYWLADKDLLLENYEVVEKGRRKLIDREGIVLEVASWYEGRPSIEMVVDARTSLLLAAEFRDYSGETTFRSEFTTLLLDPELPERGPRRSRGVKRRCEDVEKVWKSRAGSLPFTALEPRYLPDGFRKTGSWRTRRSTGLKTVYSDGMCWIEISLSPGREGSEEKVVKQHRRGSRTSMSMVLDGVSVHLVGRLEPGELLKVLRSLGPRTDS